MTAVGRVMHDSLSLRDVGTVSTMPRSISKSGNVHCNISPQQNWPTTQPHLQYILGSSITVAYICVIEHNRPLFPLVLKWCTPVDSKYR